MSTGNYIRGDREQAHNFGDIGSLAKKQKKKKKKKKPPFCLIFLSFFCFCGASPPDPLVNSKYICFRTNMLIKIDL